MRPVDLFPQTPHIECVALLEAGPDGVANPDRDGSLRDDRHPHQPLRPRQRLPRRGGRRAHARSTRCSRAAPSAILKAAGGREIKRIALTHAHGDHVGSLDALAEQLPGVEVLISGRDARLLAKDMTLDPGEEKGKLRGGYPGAKTPPDADGRARRADRLARGRRRARPHARPGRLPRHARPHALLRRRLLHARRRRHHREGIPALPAAGEGHVAPPDRAREREGAARARARAARAGPRQGRRVARRPRWTRRSPAARARRPGPSRSASRARRRRRARSRPRGRPAR